MCFFGPTAAAGWFRAFASGSRQQSRHPDKRQDGSEVLVTTRCDTTRCVILSVTLQLLARVVAEGRSWDWVLPAAIAHGATELSTAVDRNTPAVSRMTGRFP